MAADESTRAIHNAERLASLEAEMKHVTKDMESLAESVKELRAETRNSFSDIIKKMDDGFACIHRKMDNAAPVIASARRADKLKQAFILAVVAAIGTGIGGLVLAAFLKG